MSKKTVSECRSEAYEFRAEDVHLPVRRRDAHKGDFGKIYMVAGSVGLTGAPVLAAGGALRSGAGLITLGVPASVWPVVAGKCLEVMAEPLPEEPGGTLSADGIPRILDRLKGKSAVLVGPGLGRTAGVEAVVDAILTHAECPVVVDADGLNALSAHIDRLDGRKALTVLTPHAGEYERLGGGAPAEFARLHNCVLVLKGHRTVTAFPTGEIMVNTTGNPGMAKGGSGDVLAGMITSLLGQGIEPFEAIPAAVWLHGRAGDLCAEEKGEYGMTPGDLIEKLPYVCKDRTQSGFKE
ncbi:MAG: NAD(P)H-hydrate dehydratase [Clostridia bacterium]|nr:NAD(P)H-hydrate dehydratase [Clostridia bacterium]